MKHLWFVFLAWAALLAAGCAGGGSGGGGSADDATVNFFATDDLSTGYDAVWVKIYKISLRKADDSLTTIYDDSAGRVVNLRALNNGGNLYSYFGFDGVAAGTYSGMRIELDRSATLFATGSTTGQVRVFDDVYGTDRCRLDVVFGSAVTIGAGAETNLVADFDLSAWVDAGGEIRNAVVIQGSGSGLNDPTNHQEEDFRGTVQALSGTAPNQTFVLVSNSRNKVEVETNSDTAVYNNNGQPNPTLANGKRVEVRGTFHPVSGRLIASSVRIKGSNDNDEFEVKGPPSLINKVARTFRVTVRECGGFLPVGSTVNVQVNNSTRFFARHGLLISEAQFFEAMLAGGSGLEVEVEGSVYDSATNTLTANKCKLEFEGEGGGEAEAEARGTASAIDPVAYTFNLTLTSWEGFSASMGQTVGVQTTASTEFKDSNNNSVSRAQFFVLLAASTTVKVEGDYENGVLIAAEASLRAEGGGGGGGEDPHEIGGWAFNANAAARAFTVTVIDWFGFNGSAGMQVAVVMNASASYRDDDGNAITEAQFFAALSAGSLVEVEGVYNASTNTMAGVKAKLDDD